MAALFLAVPPARAEACQTSLVPAYFQPGVESPWEYAMARAVPGTTMILNPASGPGNAPVAGYQNTVRRARLAGIAVIGYVHTSWGKRSLRTVRAEVARYQAWYGVDGIFFDEAATSPRALPYYRSARRQTKKTGNARVVFNHGTVPHQRYMRLADVAVIFEGNADEYQRSAMPPWASAYPAHRFAALVYATPQQALQGVLGAARQRGVGYVYVTDDVLSNPWDRLPSYYDTERTALAQCPAG